MLGRSFRVRTHFAGFKKYIEDDGRRSYQNHKVVSQSLKSQVVLITGANAGIGESCAWQFAEEGCYLVLVGRRNDRLQSLKKEITTAFPQVDVYTVAMSVTDFDKVAELPKNLPEKFRNVDILVNNAGLALGVTPAESNDVMAAKTVMDTNVLGTIALCSAFLPGMKERGSGHLINMGSIAGYIGNPGGSTYNASKFAVRGFTEAARHDLVGTPIRVTHISPGMVGGTEFNKVRLGDDNKAAAVFENIVALHPNDVADNVFYAATRPAHVQIAEIIVFPTNQSGPSKDVVRAGPTLGKNRL